MKPPCEIFSGRVLPSVRSILVEDLSERHGLGQEKIAKKLGLTQAAVSQYLSAVRGDEKVVKELKSSQVFSRIREFSDKIVQGSCKDFQTIQEYCSICECIVEEEIFCSLYAENVSFISEKECKDFLKSGKVKTMEKKKD